MRGTRTTRALAAIGLTAILLLLAGCRAELVVRVTTRIFHDGSASRRLAVTGRTAERETPDDDGWLAETAGVALADPAAWSHVHRGAGTLRAERFTAAGEALEPTLAYRFGERLAPTLETGSVEVERRGVLTRWHVAMTHGDPIGPHEAEAALDRLIELAGEVARDELTRWLGADVDPEPGLAALGAAGRSIGRGLLEARQRTTPSGERAAPALETWRQLLTRFDTPPAGEDDDAFTAVSRVLRDEVAAALRRDGSPIAPETLGFWPLEPDGELWDELVTRHWGDDEALLEQLSPTLDTLGGYFGGEATPRFRFELRYEMPGTLMRTNGTPDGNAAFWIVRNDDMTITSPAELIVTSVEADPERLVALGAPRDLDLETLVRLEDLLWRRDPRAVLGHLLDRAIGAGDLAVLLEADGDEVEGLDTSLELLAQELGELLAAGGRSRD